MATTRNSSIELLRLLAIFGIVVMHINGPLLGSAFGLNSIWIQLENSIFNCGVSVFVLISGYFGIRRTSFKILLLELSALLYSLAGSLLVLFVSGGGIPQLIAECISTERRFLRICLTKRGNQHIIRRIDCIRQQE